MKFCWANYLLWIVIAMFGTAAMLTACGQKGPLYLPKDQSKNKTVKKTDTKTDTNEEEKKKKQ